MNFHESLRVASTEFFPSWFDLNRRQHLANKKQHPQRSTQKEAFGLQPSTALWIISRLFRFYQENSTGKWFIKNSTEDNKVNVLKDVATIPFNPSVHSILFCWLNRYGVCSDEKNYLFQQSSMGHAFPATPDKWSRLAVPLNWSQDIVACIRDIGFN